MGIKNYILRGLGLLMLVCVFTSQISASVAFTSVETIAADDDAQKHIIKTHSHETVFPHYDFSFADLSGFFQENQSFFFSNQEEKFPKGFSYPINTYLAKLFEHHIAINAP